MTKATNKRKHLTGGWLAVLEGESMTIVSENTAAGRHGAGAGTESLHVIHKHWVGGERGRDTYRQTEQD